MLSSQLQSSLIWIKFITDLFIFVFIILTIEKINIPLTSVPLSQNNIFDTQFLSYFSYTREDAEWVLHSFNQNAVVILIDIKIKSKTRSIFNLSNFKIRLITSGTLYIEESFFTIFYFYFGVHREFINDMEPALTQQARQALINYLDWTSNQFLR